MACKRPGFESRNDASQMGCPGGSEDHPHVQQKRYRRGQFALICPRASLNFRITGDILHVMQAQAPPLLPLLRSRLQAELLTLVLLTPGREWTLTELANRVGGSVSSAQREMIRAEQTGVIKSRRLGHTRLVSAADSPLTGPLTELLLRSFGPARCSRKHSANLTASRPHISSVPGQPATWGRRGVPPQIWTSW